MPKTLKIIDAMNRFEGKQAIKELLFAIATERAKGERIVKILHNGEKSTIARGRHVFIPISEIDGRMRCSYTQVIARHGFIYSVAVFIESA